jgi:hypothetical protein
MRTEHETKDLADACVWLLGHGCTLYAHQDVLYICTAQEGHLHALSDGPCTRPCPRMGSCNWNAVRLLAQRYEPRLWALLALDPCCATCYHVDTATWHPEWIAADAEGQLFLVVVCPFCGRPGDGWPCLPRCADDDDE